MLYKNYASFAKMILLVLFAFIMQGCEQSDKALSTAQSQQSNSIRLTPSELKADQKQIAQAVGECLRNKVSSVEHLADSRKIVAKRLHHVCLPQFIALRQSKLAYVDVPDVFSPPPKVLQEELDMSYQVVDIRRKYIKELVHKRMQENPMGINPHQYRPYHNNPHKNLPEDLYQDLPQDLPKNHGKDSPPSTPYLLEDKPSTPNDRI